MNPIISDADLRVIQHVAEKNKNDRKFFNKFLKKKRVVSENDLPERTVRLNSLVLLWHSILKKVVKFRIVLPHEADLKQGNISVFAPISMAIFGSREMESVQVRVEGMEKHLRIIKVLSH